MVTSSKARGSSKTPLQTRIEQGKRLKELFLRAGHQTATAAAQSIEVPVPTFLAHVSGGRSISQISAARYAKSFGSTVAWILLGDGVDTDGVSRDAGSEVSKGSLVERATNLAKDIESACSTLGTIERTMLLTALEYSTKMLRSGKKK